MTNVIAVFDIGKTNKKLFLFNNLFEVVYQDAMRFDEVTDDDGDSCDDIDAIEQWIITQVHRIQKEQHYNIKAINFSTHGATVVYLNKQGKRYTPLYNYLKPLHDFDFTPLYNQYGGVEAFSRTTASPAYGMLNSGMQLYWLKYAKPHFWAQMEHVLHYPQYLSYLFTKSLSADFTSLGAHTAMWNFDEMQYHSWLKEEGIHLPKPTKGNKSIITQYKGREIAVGTGLHDSSSSLIPLLEENREKNRAFVLLSTGTWIISMNPFSKEKLTQHQLNNNCLCFLTPEKQQVKSSMQFLGRVHEVNAEALSKHFKVADEHFLEIGLDRAYCAEIMTRGKQLFFSSVIPKNHLGDLAHIGNYNNYQDAYYQLIYEIALRVYKDIQLILDEDNTMSHVYITGGFNKNDIFVEYLAQMMPDKHIEFPEAKNASALGAALMMQEYL